MNLRLTSLITLFLLLWGSFAMAQVDTEFWFAAPKQGSGFTTPVFVRGSTFNKPATVTISIPANPTFTPIVQQVAANSIFSIDMSSYLSFLVEDSLDVVSNKGLLITATAKITVYYELGSSANPDLFSLKGGNALGTSFVLTSLKKNWGRYADHGPALLVVATEDGTNVTITPSVDLVGHSKAAGAFVITLNRGEVYQTDVTSSSATGSVGGTLISSDKPVSVTVSQDLQEAPGGCADLAGDQLVPTNLAGNQFVTLPGGLNITSLGGLTDVVYVYATEDSTIVTVNGVVVDTINLGEWYERNSVNNTYYIETNKPVLVYQIGGFGCEVGAALVPQIACTGSTTVPIVRSTAQTFFINLLVKSGAEGGFTFNGRTDVITADSFSVVPNTNDEWMWAKITLSTSILPAGAGAQIKNSLPFHLGMINGQTLGGTRYGYFSNFGGFEPDAFIDIEGFQWALNTSLEGIAYQWYYSEDIEGTFAAIDGATSDTVRTNQAGYYYVEVRYDEVCEPVISEILDVQNEILMGAIPTDLCPGASFEVSYISIGEYNEGNVFTVEVSDGSGNFANAQEVGMITTTDSIGTITVTIPEQMATITGYRFRIKSSDPIAFSSDNDIDFQINPIGAPDILVSDPSAECDGLVTLRIPSQGSHIKLSGGPSSTGSYVSMPNTLGTTTNFTFECWVNLRSSDQWARIFDFYNDTQVYFYFTVRTSQTNKPQYAISKTGIPGEQRIRSDIEIPLNQWTHLAITVDGTTKVGIMYINGVEVGRNDNMTLTPAGLPVTENNTLGKSAFPVNPNLNAELDEVRFWNISRSVDDITRSFTTRYPAGTPGLVSYYSFDEGTGTSSQDLANEDLSATLVNDVLWVTPSESPSGGYTSYSWVDGPDSLSYVVSVNGTYSATVVSSVGCSAIASVEVTNVPPPCCRYPDEAGAIAGNQTICPNTLAAPLASTTAASGQTGELQYRWQQSTISAEGEFNDIANTDSPTYSPGILSQTTWYRRLAGVDCFEDWSGAAISNVIQVVVIDTTPPAIQCFNTTIRFNGESMIPIPVSDVVTASDDCGVESIVLTPSSISCEQLGQVVPVQIVVTDVNGNVSACMVQVTVRGLPCGWRHNTGSVGTCTSDIDYNTVTGQWPSNATSCRYGSPFTSDKLMFAQYQLCGDGSITAQVIALDGAQPFAGITMRENNDVGAKKVQLMINRISNILRREVRTSTGSQCFPTEFPSPCERTWLRITRTGNIFRGYTSQDGQTWWYVMQVHVPMNSCIEIGLVLTNMQNNIQGNGTFANVSVTGGQQGPVVMSAGMEQAQEDAAALDVRVYPNPVAGELQVDLSAYMGRRVELALYDIQGQLLFVRELGDGGVETERIDMSGLPAGVYQLQVRTPGAALVSRRVIVQKK